MAQTDTPAQPAGNERPTFSESDKGKARQWFKKAKDCRDRREYDYAIECAITGLSFWPDAVEEGHMPLYSIALQRQQAGGKKASMMEAMRHPTTGKDAKQAMLNAEFLLAKEPGNASYLDALLKNAAKADYADTVKWIAPLVFDSLRREKKPSAQRFKAYRQSLVECAERADARNEAPLAAWMYEQAVHAVEYLIARNPSDMALKDEQRDLAGKQTIAKGKYAEAETFRESLRDADKQKQLHDAERVQQGEHTLQDLLASVRQAYEADPANPLKISAYVEALTRAERKSTEDLAIGVLEKAYADTKTYNFKLRADDLRLRQLRRQTRQLAEAAAASGSEEDAQQARLAAMEEAQTELEIARERAQVYPTESRYRFRLAEALFRASEFDEAIPLFQATMSDPRYRSRCQTLMGRAFLERGIPAQAVEVLLEALQNQESEDTTKESLYWLGRAYEADGRAADAIATYGKLLRIDYNYNDGETRRRLDALRSAAPNQG